jgi:hypothetical protein
MNYLSIRDFVSLGYLQELNRQFLHPLGLALEVEEIAGGKYAISGVQDFRGDPEGMMFSKFDEESIKKAAYVQKEWENRIVPREEALTWMIQPCELSEEKS